LQIESTCGGESECPAHAATLRLLKPNAEEVIVPEYKQVLEN
jgi:hypothetical protein